MNIAYITTTIRPPTAAMRVLRRITDAPIIVAGDLRTPHHAWDGDDWTYLHPDDQKGWRSSNSLGWNCIQRRNIALLEALKYEPDVIVTIDDDNIPLGEEQYESWFLSMLGYEPERVVVGPEWWNPGVIVHPQVTHRGFPVTGPYPWARARWDKNTRGLRVGVVAGMWLGDPDVNAVERLANPKLVSTLEGAAFVAPHVKTPHNSQNTGFLRELAPCSFVLPFVDRYDDIFASYIAHRVMEETRHCTYYGYPLVNQERNPHDLLTDLQQEMYGMRVIEEFAELLADADLERATVTDATSDAVDAVAKLLPNPTLDFVSDWMRDLEEVL